MAYREQAGVTEQQVDRQRQKAKDEDLRDEGHPERADHDRRHQRGSKHETREGDTDVVGLHLYPPLPKMPCGLNSIRMAIGPNSTK